MEESPLLSLLPHKIIKPETSHQLNNQDFHHCSTSRRGGAKQDSDSPVPLPPGQVSFRLLCRFHTAGGVIGSSGTVIKRLEALCGVKIRIEKGLPNCHERVINILGDATVKKKISIIGSLKNGGNEDKEMVEGSKAQEGLIRVFERVLEVQGDVENENENDDINSNSKGLIGCRLLAAAGQIGAVLGKGGKIVNGIQNNSGAKIAVLKEHIPACAEPQEAVIQIRGGVASVKKALLAISCCLQDCKLGERTPGQMSSRGVSHDILKYSILNSNSNSPTFSGNAVDYHPVVHSLSEDIDRKLSMDEDSTLKNVVFRLLCSNASAGGVIGKGANLVKSLEKETGACIKFSSLASGLSERVATISSLENPNPLHSPAQIAIIRVFTRSVQVALDYGLTPGMGKGENVTARILVARNQMGCLADESGRVASDISTASGVEIQLLGAGLIPNCTVEDDKVVQIIGEYENVKSALLQVTGRLRENYFPRMGFHSSDSATACSSSNGRAKTRRNFTRSEDDAKSLKTFSSGLKNERLDEDGTLKNVVFRFLCSNTSAGGVIGKGANLIKSLEKETGACIKFSSLASGLSERVATISSLEDPNPLYSPAQNAVIHVFTRSVQVALVHGLIPGIGKGENVNARILVERNQTGCLVDEGGRVASDISTACGVEIQILGSGLIPNCTIEDDKVVQIIGEYENVKNALFQVTGRVRDNYFPRMGFNVSEHTHSSDPAMACSSSNGRVMDFSSQLEQLSRLSSVNQLHKSSHPLSTGSRQKNVKTRRNVTRLEDDAGNLKTFSSGLKNKSKVADAIPYKTVEVLIPHDVFRFVYGDNSSNLIRLKEVYILKTSNLFP
ncbi:KH domain-containing HEN4-like [Olea europaea subsp. europaea]|uniref:KH domain-containing HEN4-like n=1 Tax=Olea europaea subsp. europaea TaxID=158383 RepID=A0A8S0RKX2_OLEEU|nr:KH domain-containing HEN4-like [Olea europaea subsp. europaea]